MTPWQRLCERTLSVAQIREVDRIAVDQFHMHSLLLMENAALTSAGWLVERFGSSFRTVILCGRGNNGGDGLALARHLRLAGWSVEVIVLGPVERLSPDAYANWRILTARDNAHCSMFEPEEFATADEQVGQRIGVAQLVIDAMLGSGASGSPRAPFDRWIEQANRARCSRVALDIPTGLDAESGAVAEGTFRADATLTFVARKPGFSDPRAKAMLGEVVVLPIGIPVELIEQLLDQSESSGPGGGS